MTDSWTELLRNEKLLQKIADTIPEPTPQKLLKKLITTASCLITDKAPSVNGSAGEVQLVPSADPEVPDPVGSIWHGLQQTARELRLEACRQHRLLALKLAAHLSWNLQLLDDGVPQPLQQCLYNWILSECSQQSVPDSDHHQSPQLTDVESHSLLDLSTIPAHAVFAIVAFHRWVLWSVCTEALPRRPPKTLNIPMPANLDTDAVPAHMIESTNRLLEHQESGSVQLLQRVLEDGQLPAMVLPSAECFGQCVSEDCHRSRQWHLATQLDPGQVACQLNFELGRYLFFRGEYTQSAKHFSQCRSLLPPSLPSSSLSPLPPPLSNFIFFSSEELTGYCRAVCSCFPTDSSPPASPSCPEDSLQLVRHCVDQLLEQVEQGTASEAVGEQLIQLLTADVWRRQLSGWWRDGIAVELHECWAKQQQQQQQEMSPDAGSDLLMKIDIVNCLHRCVGGECVTLNVVPYVDSRPDLAQFLLESVARVVDNLLAEDDDKSSVLGRVGSDGADSLPSASTPRGRLVLFLLNLCSRCDVLAVSTSTHRVRQLLALPDTSGGVWRETSPTREHCKLTVDATDSTLLSDDPVVEYTRLQRWLCESFDPDCLAESLGRLLGHDVRPVDQYDDVPGQVMVAIDRMPVGYHRELFRLMVAKSRHAIKLKRFDTSLGLLAVLQTELKSGPTSMAPAPLHKHLQLLVDREQLLVELLQQLHVWPKLGDYRQLTARVTGCLAASTAELEYRPNSELLDQCVLHLLNVCDWEQLLKVPAVNWPLCELLQMLACVCREMVNNKSMGNIGAGTRRVSRDLWNAVILKFSSSSQQKRGYDGGSVSRHRDSGHLTTISRNQFSLISNQICEHTSLSILVSLLTRLHNVLRDDSTREICLEHVALWPNAIANASSFSLDYVSESLRSLLDRATRLYPAHISWLLGRADLCFVEEEFSVALRYYLEACTVSSEYFVRPVSRAVLSEVVIRRMVRCCSTLRSYTQGAVLCQFLEEVDYNTAFQLLSERGACADAADLYYPCIWDMTLLEYLAHLHHRRGELQKRRLTVELIGQLELNISNNDEIQQQAAAARRSRFLRAMVRQYCMSGPWNQDGPGPEEQAPNQLLAVK